MCFNSWKWGVGIMLDIQLGNCTADNRVVDKTSSITLGSPISCAVYNECSIMNPMFKLSYNATLVNYNYAYVQAWGRYYFIIDHTVAPGGVIYITCQEDVLMSNKDDILKLNAQIVRNENERNKLIVDDRYPAEIMSTLGIFNFSANPFNLTSGYNIVMTVLGGKASS